MAEVLETTSLPKVSPQARLKKYLATHRVPVATTSEELFAHSVSDDDGEEINEFLTTLAEWRREKYESRAALD